MQIRLRGIEISDNIIGKYELRLTDEVLKVVIDFPSSTNTNQL